MSYCNALKSSKDVERRSVGAIVSWITAVDGRVAYVRKILRIYFNKNFCNAAEFVTVVSSGGHESSAPHVLVAQEV